MDEEKDSSSPNQKWGDGVSELVYSLQNDVKAIKEEQVDMKVEQAILKETQALTNGYIEKSINVLTENVKFLSSMFSEIKEQNNRMERQFQLEKQKFESEVSQIKECNKSQDEKIKTVSLKEHAVNWWSNPISKLSSGIVLIIIGWLATQLGLPLEQILK